MIFDVVAKGTVNQKWLRAQPDLRLVEKRPWGARHSHGEVAKGGRAARHDVIVLLDSDAHPVDAGWLGLTAEMLDEHRPFGRRSIPRAAPGQSTRLVHSPAL